MNFNQIIFLLIALVAVTGAQDMELVEDMDLEALEDVPSSEPDILEPIEELEGHIEESKEQMKDFTEWNFEVNPSQESTRQSTPGAYESSEGTTPSDLDITDSKEEILESTQVMTDSTDSTTESNPEMAESTETVAILFEEIDPMDGTSTEPQSVIQTSTDSRELISEYNGFDVNKNGSTFSCYGRAFGQYADVQKECHVFHLCYPYFNSTTDELLYQRITFLCDNDSVFDQKRFICVDNSTVDHKCSDSEDLYLQTNQEYLIRVFSLSVSPVDEVNGEPTLGSAKNWISWLYGN